MGLRTTSLIALGFIPKKIGKRIEEQMGQKADPQGSPAQGPTGLAQTAFYMRLILRFVQLPKLSSRRMVRPVNEFPISMTERVRAVGSSEGNV